MLLALAVVVALAGCGSPSSGGQLTPGEIGARVLEASQGIKTYKFDMDMSMNVSGQGKAEMRQSSNMTGAMDKVAAKMWMDVSVETDLPQQPGIPEGRKVTQEAEVYVVGDNIYVRAIEPGMSSEWQQAAVPEGLWAQQDAVAQQIGVLGASQLEVLGEEMVRGIDAYVLQVTPDVNRFWELMKERLGAQALPAGVDPAKVIKRLSVKEWIAKDTFYPVRVQQGIVMETSSESLVTPGPEGGFELTMDIKLDLAAYDYNQAVSIELPAELGSGGSP